MYIIPYLLILIQVKDFDNLTVISVESATVRLTLPALNVSKCFNNHLAHALLYAHLPRGLKKLPAREVYFGLKSNFLKASRLFFSTLSHFTALCLTFLNVFFVNDVLKPLNFTTLNFLQTENLT